MEKFIDILDRCEEKRLSYGEAAEILGMSERTLRRYRRRYEECGLEGLNDRRLGRKPARTVPADKASWMIEQYETRYMGWNVKHFHDHLVKHHNFNWGYTWTKTQLQRSGLVIKVCGRGKHRRKRPRRPCIGMMLHQDGSTHEWFEGQPKLDLIVTMDDATSEVYSAFLVDEEGTMSSFRGFLDVFESRGLPCSIYTDRGSHYFYTPKAGEKVDKTRLTQVGRALHQLGIEHIAAYSPEARGRSERAFQTFQDRLVNELKLHGITDMAAANRYMTDVYLPDHNARFAVAPEDETSAFVPIAAPAALRDIMCTHTERIVRKDNTVSYNNRVLQIPQSPYRHHYVKARVRVHEYQDGTIAIFHGPGKIATYSKQGEIIIRQQTKKAA
jgi:transposase